MATVLLVDSIEVATTNDDPSQVVVALDLQEARLLAGELRNVGTPVASQLLRKLNQTRGFPS